MVREYINRMVCLSNGLMVGEWESSYEESPFWHEYDDEFEELFSKLMDDENNISRDEILLLMNTLPNGYQMDTFGDAIRKVIDNSLFFPMPELWTINKASNHEIGELKCAAFGRLTQENGMTFSFTDTVVTTLGQLNEIMLAAKDMTISDIDNMLVLLIFSDMSGIKICMPEFIENELTDYIRKEKYATSLANFSVGENFASYYTFKHTELPKLCEALCEGQAVNN